MERDDLKNDLIAYLYGEMSGEERLKFEKKLESDPDLKNELQEFKQVRKGLSHMEDKEVMEPFFLWGRNGTAGKSYSFGKRSMILFKPIVAVAASLVILMLVGYLTGFSISYREKDFFMGFKQTGHPQTAEVLSAEQVRALVKNEIEQSNHQILNTLQNSENRMEARFTSLETTQEKLENRPAPPMITEKDLKIFYTQLQQTNATLMENYLQNATVQQQEYFQTVMNQFTDYLQAQREEDLRVIRRNLVNLKQDQDQQQQETQQILATLLNNVNNSNN